jgi:MFS family permease
MDFIAILIVTPLSDRFHHHRAAFFSGAVMIQISGLLVTTFAGNGSKSWARYGGLLMVGFGLGPTVPICMTWTNEIFQPRHGEVGVAAASALVSGLGNLGSILTTYALYTGWPADATGQHKYRKSNLVMIGILCASILSAGAMVVLLRLYGNEKVKQSNGASSSEGEGEGDAVYIDGAARREEQQRGLGRMFWSRRR